MPTDIGLNEVIASINAMINLFDGNSIIELYICVAIRWNIIMWAREYSFKTQVKTNWRWIIINMQFYHPN